MRALRRAMELDPADGDVRFFHGIALQAAGHTDPRTGLEWIARDPLSPLANILVAANSWFTGRPIEGLPALEEAVRLAPAGLIFHLAESYAMAGAHDHAVILLDRAVTLGFYPHDYYARLCPFYDALRGREDFARVLDRAARRIAEFRESATT